jgi:hypothetical protein
LIGFFKTKGSTMTKRNVMAAFAVTLLAGACSVAGDGLKSGPQEGKPVPGPFHPLNVTGESAGRKNCLV